MSDDVPYALLDAGAGRRLERFGDRIVDRPHPGVIESPRAPARWTHADLTFDRDGGWRSAAGAVPAPWTVRLEGLELELRPTATGQVGVFPEQQASWRWLAAWLARRVADGPAGRPPRLLNLFAYTGVASLLAAAAGAAVAHVDAARPAVAWARRNAELSGLADRPVRWLVDDAETFVAREIRRGRRYDAVVLDPPTYGHGGRAPWRIEESLARLLDGLRPLLADAPLVLLTAHTEGWDGDRLADLLAAQLRLPARAIESGSLEIVAETDARLPLGSFARHAG